MGAEPKRDSLAIAADTTRNDVEFIKIPANDTAIALGNERAANIVMLGAYIGYMQFIDENLVLDCILRLLGKKPEFIELNKKAFAMGLAAGKQARG